tara:strand:+ start:221 stop:706 length:486 start_codon:yes stop_codon:yes gene_type:complete
MFLKNMSRENKTLNLREGAFPIKMNLFFNETSLKDIGQLKDSITGDIEISLISKDLFRFEGTVRAIFIDQCQSCLKDIQVGLNFSSNLAIKDETLMMEDNSNQDQTHYQNLEYFNIKQLIEEEISLSYPNIVKCEEECMENRPNTGKEKNLPFKKIRDLID